MTNLTIATGVVEYSLNDTCHVAFNPTDATFVERVYQVFDKLDKQQDARTARIKEIEAQNDSAALFSYSREVDEEMRADINDLFGTDVCAPLFGAMNVYAFADGLPLWANLLFAIMDVINSANDEQREKMSPRLNAYIAKYKRK